MLCKNRSASAVRDARMVTDAPVRNGNAEQTRAQSVVQAGDAITLDDLECCAASALRDSGWKVST